MIFFHNQHNMILNKRSVRITKNQCWALTEKYVRNKNLHISKCSDQNKKNCYGQNKNLVVDWIWPLGSGLETPVLDVSNEELAINKLLRVLCADVLNISRAPSPSSKALS